MREIVLTGIREMSMRETDEPELTGEHDVLIRLGVVGVCGSDVHYYTTGRIGSQVVEYPFRVGHECSGIVEAVGQAVTRVKPGDRIAVEPAMPCEPWAGQPCDQCRSGRINTCRKLTFLGCPGQADGCLAEKIVMPENCCFPVGPSTTLTQAALVEPLTIGVYGVQQSIDLPGADVAVLGAGPIGLCTMLPATLARPKTICVSDKIESRLAVAADHGADVTANAESDDVVARFLQACPGGMDCVFECCGQQDAIDQAVELLKPGGKLMITGIPQVDRISFTVDQIRRKEITIYNVRRQAHCVEKSLAHIEQGDFDLGFMVTHTFDFEQTQQAFDLVDDYADGVIKAMIDFHAE